MGFPDSAEVKNLPANAGDTRDVGSIPELERYPGKKKWPRAPVFLPGKSHGQRNLAGYSPWDRKDLDTTLQLNHNIFSVFGVSPFYTHSV